MGWGGSGDEAVPAFAAIAATWTLHGSDGRRTTACGLEEGPACKKSEYLMLALGSLYLGQKVKGLGTCYSAAYETRTAALYNLGSGS